ncbi:MAG: DUF4105 domain-containing protein [Phycisphaeraceae bacterium]|nr:DUF4105 domain-containing protein [Phycisphaeraceae bacterium]
MPESAEGVVEDRATQRTGWRRSLALAGLSVLWLSLVIAALWSVGAILYSNLPWAWVRVTLTGVFIVGCVGLAGFYPRRRSALVIFLGAFGVVLIWFLLTPASNTRDWMPDVAVAPSVQIDGDRVTIRNVRDFAYRSEADYDARYTTRTVDLSRLKSIDLIMSYWGPTLICHTFVTFGFDDGQFLCCSIETRKKKGDEYSAIRGLYRQYELIYIWAEERDVIGLRTNHRGEEVFVYRLEFKPERLRRIFLDYLDRTISMETRPEWYNAVTNSCGMNIIYSAAARRPWIPLKPNLLMNGRWDRVIYESGHFSTPLPFPEFRAQSRVNTRAQAAEGSTEFSARIREGLPSIPAAPTRPGG